MKIICKLKFQSHRGVYKFRLEVDDGEYSSFDEIFVFVSETSDFPPNVNLDISSWTRLIFQGLQFKSMHLQGSRWLCGDS